MRLDKLNKKCFIVNIIALSAITAFLTACDKPSRESQNIQNSDDVVKTDEFTKMYSGRPNGYLSVLHDNKRNVTCWQVEKGISCLPDESFGVKKETK